MAAHIAERHITGWYLRVLEEGAVEPGVDFVRIGRNAEPLSITDLLALWAEHRPDPQRLLDVAGTPRIVVALGGEAGGSGSEVAATGLKRDCASLIRNESVRLALIDAKRAWLKSDNHALKFRDNMRLCTS